MKKNSPKKLALHRETVRNLQNEEIKEAAGGGYHSEYSCINSCDTATRWACTFGC